MKKKQEGEELLRELKIDDKKAGVDIIKLNNLIQLGKPIKTFGFIPNGYGSIGLFETYNGENIFHLLARKSVLSTVVPTIFDNANAILAREGIKENPKSFLKKAINALNKDELTPADLAARNNDFAGLQTLDQYGANVIQSDAWLLGNSKYLLGLQTLTQLQILPMDYAHVIESDNWTKMLENNSKFRIESSPIFFFMTRAMNNNTPLTDDFVKLFGRICTNSNISDHIKLDYLPSIIERIKSSKQDEGRKKKLCAIIQDLLGARSKSTNSAGVGIEHTTKKGGLSVLSDITEKVINTQQPKEDKKTPLANNTENIDKENTVSVSSVDQKIVPKSNKPELREATIEEYAESVIKYIVSTPELHDEMKRLGPNPGTLHSLIFAANAFEFDQILEIIAKKPGVSNKIPQNFLKEYIDKITSQDLIDLRSTVQGFRVNAYDLTCMLDDPIILELLLKQGIKVGLYTQDTDSLFQPPLKFHRNKILDYLLTEQKHISPNWSYILFQAVKYANLHAVEHYVKSGFVTIETVVDKNYKTNTKGEYTILNKTLEGLKELSKLASSQSEYKGQAIKKIPKLSKCLETMIDHKKMYYSVDPVVLTKTMKLLTSLHLKIKSISDTEIQNELDKIKNLVIDSYVNLAISEEARNAIQGIRNDEVMSQTNTVCQSDVSVLSDMGNKIMELVGDTNGETISF
jgi:hypothetical protein